MSVRSLGSVASGSPTGVGRQVRGQVGRQVRHVHALLHRVGAEGLDLLLLVLAQVLDLLLGVLGAVGLVGDVDDQLEALARVVGDVVRRAGVLEVLERVLALVEVVTRLAQLLEGVAEVLLGRVVGCVTAQPVRTPAIRTTPAPTSAPRMSSTSRLDDPVRPRRSRRRTCRRPRPSSPRRSSGRRPPSRRPCCCRPRRPGRSRISKPSRPSSEMPSGVPVLPSSSNASLFLSKSSPALFRPSIASQKSSFDASSGAPQAAVIPATSSMVAPTRTRRMSSLLSL